MLFIRQGATHKVALGPAVAVGDGFTPVTTLALSTADEAEAILHDNGTVVNISGYTWAAITTADGYYHLTLQSGISGTVGHMTVVVNDDSLCLPLRADFTVLEEAVYDQFFAASAPGAATVAALATVDTVVDGIQTDLDNGTDGLGAIKTDTAAILTDTADMQPKLGTPAGASMSADIAAIEAQTDDIGVAGAGLTALAQASVCTEARMGALTDWIDGGRLDLIIDAILQDTGTTLQGELDGIQADTEDIQTQIGTAGAGLTNITLANDLSATMKTSVQTAVDAAIDTAISELGVGAPTATPTLRTGLMLLYMVLRNKLVVQTSGTDAIEVYNDAGTKIAAKLITDDSADYTEAEMA